MNPDNDWYGHKQVLADYCHQPRARPIWGYVPHGWDFNLYEGAGLRRFHSAPYLVWNKRHEIQARERGLPNVRVMGAPFVYLLERLNKLNSTPSGGTIVFPAHSADGTEVLNGPGALIAQTIAQFPPPYSVSIYYKDLNSPELAAYRQSGWRIVTFGTRLNRLFLYDLASELHKHSTVISNVPQTAIWYGALLGKTVKIIGQSPSFSKFGPTHNEQTVRSNYASTLLEVRTAYPKLFDEGLSDIEAFDAGSVELGYSYKMIPEDLAKLLGWSSRRKRLAAKSVHLLSRLRYANPLSV